MPRELTLGVLSPYLSGSYHGGILAGITRAAAAADGAVIGIQTRDARTHPVTDPPARDLPLAWQHVAGFIVVDDAVAPGHLAALRSTGKPVVTIDHGSADPDCAGPVEPLGQAAVTALLGELAGDGAPDGPVLGRESCGCRGASPPAAPAASAVDAVDAVDAMASHLRRTLTTQYEVSLDVLGNGADPQRLGWLARTSARAGCLAFWAEGRSGTPADAALDVVGTYDRDRAEDPTPAQTTTVSLFPPAELLGLARERPDDLVLVVPVKLDDNDWGLLAVVDTVETAVPTGRDPLNQCAALLTVALDHRAVLRELRDHEEQLRVAARYDHLTGLSNRSLFLCRVDAAIAGLRQDERRRFAVLLLDLDGFKVVNDSLGHSVGDRLLVQVAERIKACLRECDLPARSGGDEFLVLLEGVDDDEAPARIAQRLHAALARPFHLHGREIVVTTSIGIVLGARRYDRAEDLVRDADIAMYSAKSRRKGSHAVFDVAMHAKAVSRLQIETELRRAVEGDELEVHYQPIVDLPSGRTHAFEALVRWRHPVRGLVLPDEFLPVAEETGLVIPIGRRILDEACRRLAAWQRASGRADLSISLNVSNRQFWHGGLIDDVADSVRRARLAPHSVALEITEGVIMHNVGLARKMLEDLHGLGCRLHIDDFGTGYSSLEALHRLPIDALKIDRSFVSGLGVDPRSGELVRTIVLMGRNLGLELIGEGIENAEQRDHLLRLECTYGQGYLLSRPVPAEPAAALVSQRH